MEEKQHPVTIVLVEDDPGHAALIEKNLRRAGIMTPIVNLNNGREALDYLAVKKGPETPSILMLLDLTMPVLDGYEVLKAVKSDARSRCMPVVVLTAADNPREAERCYKLGCNAYITKPVGYEQFSDTMRKLGMFLSIVELPMIEELYG